MKKNSIKVNFIYNLVYNMLNIIVPLVTAPYCSRVLGASNIGIYSYTGAVVSSIIMFGSLGTATYGQKEIAANSENKKKMSSIFWEIFILKFITIMISFVCFLFLSTNDERYTYYYLLQIPYFIAAIFDVSWFFQGVEKFNYIAIRNIIVRIVGVILLVLCVKDSNDLWIYLLIICVSQMLGNITMWPYLKNYLVKTDICLKNLKYHLSEVMVYFIPTITYQIYAVLDKAMLGILVGSDYENGYYEQAHKIINMSVNIISAYTIVMRSRMSALFAQKNYYEIQQKVRKSSKIIALLVFPMSFGLCAIAKGFVPWFFGTGYEKVTDLLYIFSPIFIFMGYSRLIGTHLLTPGGRQKKSNVAQIVAAVVNVILNSVLIPKFYSAGAAAASVVSEVVIVIIYMHYVKNDISYKQLVNDGWKKFVSSIIMFGILYIVASNMEFSILNTFAQICIAVCIYMISLICLQDELVMNYIKQLLLKLKGVKKR